MAESYFSIVGDLESEPFILNMDATETAARNLKSKVTDFPVEDGGFVSDNVVNKGDVITLAGIITDIESTVSNDSTTDYIRTLERIRDAKSLVTVNVGSADGAFNSIPNCIMIDCLFSQNGEHGIADPNISSYQVKLMFKKVRIVSSAKASTKDIAVPLQDKVTAKPEAAKDETTSEVKIPNIGQNLMSIL